MCMDPKKIIASKKQKTVAGISSAPRSMGFNMDKFLGPEQEKRYKVFSSRRIWVERTFNIDLEDRPYSFMTMVKGRNMYFSRDYINEYLGNPLTLSEGELDEYAKHLARDNWNLNLVTDTICSKGKSYETNVVGAP
ncbi:hypothetical protein RYX36_032626 [Vicia faba]